MKAEAHFFSIIGRGETDNRRGRQMVRSGIDLGIDFVSGDVKSGTLRQLSDERCGHQYSGGEEGELGY